MVYVNTNTMSVNVPAKTQSTLFFRPKHQASKYDEAALQL